MFLMAITLLILACAAKVYSIENKHSNEKVYENVYKYYSRFISIRLLPLSSSNLSFYFDNYFLHILLLVDFVLNLNFIKAASQTIKRKI
jgi:hypothetical protein